MNSYETKLRARIDAILAKHLAGYDSAEDVALTDALVAFLKEETRRSFLNGLKAKDGKLVRRTRRQEPTA